MKTKQPSPRRIKRIKTAYFVQYYYRPHGGWIDDSPVVGIKSFDLALKELATERNICRNIGRKLRFRLVQRTETAFNY